MWLATADMQEEFNDGWPENKYFQVPHQWRRATIDLEDLLARQLLDLLHEHPLKSR